MKERLGTPTKDADFWPNKLKDRQAAAAGGSPRLDNSRGTTKGGVELDSIFVSFNYRQNQALASSRLAPRCRFGKELGSNTSSLMRGQDVELIDTALSECDWNCAKGASYAGDFSLRFSNRKHLVRPRRGKSISPELTSLLKQTAMQVGGRQQPFIGMLPTCYLCS